MKWRWSFSLHKHPCAHILKILHENSSKANMLHECCCYRVARSTIHESSMGIKSLPRMMTSFSIAHANLIHHDVCTNHAYMHGRDSCAVQSYLPSLHYNLSALMLFHNEKIFVIAICMCMYIYIYIYLKAAIYIYISTQVLYDHKCPSYVIR